MDADPLGIIRDRLAGVSSARAHVHDSSNTSRKIKNFWQRVKTLTENQLSEEQEGAHYKNQLTNTHDPSAPVHLIDAILPKGSISPAALDFNPLLFLSSVHTDTPMDKLQAGLETLQQAVHSRADQMKLLVQEHFGQYVFAKDTIDHLHALLQSELHGRAGRSVRLQRELQSIAESGQQIHSGFLQHHTDIQHIRQVLNILNRYQFLLELPGKLSSSIEQQNYEQLIRDYRKVKSFTLQHANAQLTAYTTLIQSQSSPDDPHASIPVAVLIEIGRIMKDVRQKLLRILDDPHVHTEQHQQIIAYLYELDSEVECITICCYTSVCSTLISLFLLLRLFSLSSLVD